jgi:hypothetical protein
MERRKLKIGMKVGIRPANRARVAPRPATVRALIDNPGYRQHRALVEYAENGVRGEVALWRIVPAP